MSGSDSGKCFTKDLGTRREVDVGGAISGCRRGKGNV